MSNPLTIRPAKADEWSEWKSVRLQALQDSPQSFGERYQDALQKNDDQWRQDFTKVMESANQELLFAIENNRTVGMLFVFIRDPDQKIGGIGGLWIAPAYRQKGAGRQIIETALEWMRSKNLLAVTFWNNTSVDASTKFYEKLGFIYTGANRPLESNPTFMIGEMKKEL